MTKRKNKRWRLIADVKIQGTLCLRLVVYWAVCQFSMIGTMLAFAQLYGPGTEAVGIGRFVIPALSVSLLLLPIALFDLIVISNRLCGPMIQFRRKLSKLVEADDTEPMRIRQGDFYADICDTLNRLCLKIQNRQHQTDSNEEHPKTNACTSTGPQG